MLREAAHKFVGKVKAKFPEPIRFEDEGVYEEAGADKLYCVGGAFIAYINGWIPFPDVEGLADMLAKHNASLEGYDRFGQNPAAKFAFDIIEANDASEFDVAWETLEDALAYKGE